MVNIVVLGDSIAYGIGSSDAKTRCFGALVGEKVNGKVTNLGISGLDSTQLLKKLDTKKFQEALKDADVVLMSIGSNDILKPFVSIVTESVGVKDEDDKEVYEKIQKKFMKMAKEEPLEAVNSLAKAILKVYASDDIEKGCEGFPKNFDAIIGKIKEINPDTLIYANNVYNPYYGVAYDYQGLTLLNVHEICELYVNEINKAFDRKSEDYTMIDMYSIFRQQGYTNVNPASIEDFSGFNFDPHPNDRGYQLMADYIYTHMDSAAPGVQVSFEADETIDNQAVPVNVKEIRLVFSEQVRPVEGKKVCLVDLTDGKKWNYSLTGAEQINVAEESTYEMNLSLADFVKDGEVLQYAGSYELVMEEGAFKDKGNNSPDELTLLGFTTEKEPGLELEANSTAVVSSGLTGSAGMKIGIFAGIVLVLVAIAGIILYNKKIRRKRETKTKE